ncbi:triose-phosphate transporter family-domain-containing protein [Pelagophyceae sp. CCMP2097]|nr:triose-phosphate transporter family-domain-containing protein [Pelagophyceae sp. CCMP2097]|mmetsp:Transcript_12990/g.44948  ORF Transcript_12990/g.44948 Transcript_12990/m.44948 type:complete len:346 (-) Transcript_12990:94-1131(-)
MGLVPDSVSLLLCFVFWYAGNMKFNEYNTAALGLVGGKTSGMTMIVSTMQLGACVFWGLLLWLVGYNPARMCGLQAPAKQKLPQTTFRDFVRIMPVGMCSAGAHAASVFALGGDPLFGQIVKSGEPVFAALVNTVVYGKAPTFLKAACLPIIVGGVAFASLKKSVEGDVASIIPGYSLKFSEIALIFGMLANTFAAFKGAENEKLMKTPGIKERIGGVGNQFALTQMISFSVSLPVMFWSDGAHWGEFLELVKTKPGLFYNVFMSGIMFYMYDELATMTVKATGPITSSVANTAKRVIVVLYMAAITGKALTEEQKIGAAIAIGGVFLYSIIDELLGKKKVTKKD